MKKEIISKGVMRSGTVLLRLILSDLFNLHKISPDYYYRAAFNEKGDTWTHSYEPVCDKQVVITTWRDPRNVILSMIRVEKKASNQVITTDTCFNQIVYNIYPSFCYIYRVTNEAPFSLDLKYEKWHKDFDYLFDTLENFFTLTISQKIREEIKVKYSKESIKNYQSKFSSFKEFDPSTHIHGNHIFKGENNWKKILDKNTLNLINPLLKPYIEKWESL
jgi:hypothetical protein